MRKELPRNREGKKMYPVCSWEKNQHKLYNAIDRINIAISEGEADWEDLERAEKALSAFDAHVIGETVYATWEDRNLIMDYVGAYNARHR